MAVACAVLAGVLFVVLRSDDPSASPGASTTVVATPTVSAAVVPEPIASGPVVSGPVVSVNTSAERVAFDGTTQGAGIPGPALSAGAPEQLLGVAATVNGDLFVTSVGVAVLSIIDGEVEPVAGFEARDSGSSGIAVAGDGTVFLATAEGVVSVRRGVRELILDGAAAGLSNTLGPLALDGGGNLYVADNGTGRVIRQAPDGALTLVAGTGTLALAGATPADGVAAVTDIGVVTGMVIDRSGNLLMTDSTLGRLRAVNPSGQILTVAVVDQPTGLAVDSRGTVFVADGTAGTILQILEDGQGEPVAGSSGTRPVALTIASSGKLIFTDGLTVMALSL